MDTAHQHGTPSIESLKRLMAQDLQQVDHCIRSHLQPTIPLINDLAMYLFTSCGKRIRPLLTLAAARLCGTDSQAHVPLATAIEFIHTATLLHDDVVDESTLRRGIETANQVWSNQACVLVGDYLFSHAFHMIIESKSPTILNVVSRASSKLAEGELAQLSQGRSIAITKTQYMDVITAKTACLFEASCKVGAIASEATPEQEKALGDFGLNLGIAFQLVDDLLDYTARQAELGKMVGDDFREGKVTLPVILTLEKGSTKDTPFWERTLQNLDQQEGDLETAIELMALHGSMTATFQEAQTYVDKAISSLDEFESSPLKSALVETAQFSVHRYY